VRKTLKEQLKELGSPFWFQVHISYIINLNHAVSFDGKAVTMRGNDRIPVSNTRREAFQKTIMQFFRNKH